MGSYIQNDNKHLIFTICCESNENKNNIDVKDNTEYKITENTEKKDFIHNIEKFNKERMARYYNYHYLSTKVSVNESKVINLILLKLYNKTNNLIDEIEVNKTFISSKFKNINKNYDDKTKKISFGKDNSSDYIIDDNSINPIQFYIGYNEIKNNFYIMDNLSGTGTFIKLNKEVKIEQDMIISFCVDYMYFTINHLNDGYNELNIKFLNKDKNNEKDSVISFDNKKDLRFTIGRSHNCNYQYDDDSVSKVQCTIIFQNNNWYLYDGYICNLEKKVSTNGLWLLTNKSICLKNQMILKTGDMKILVFEE